VAASGKNLVAIYITHAHGDHYFGLKLVLDRFPEARAVATGPVAAAIEKQIEPEFVKSFWEPRFPRQLPSELIAPEALNGKTLDLEGHALSNEPQRCIFSMSVKIGRYMASMRPRTKPPMRIRRP
jgi:glyoxylase-like metal-dependent hydrolase (beta-lactamase superfamily II)